MALVYLKDISKSYGNKVKTKALDGCSVKVERGRCLLLWEKAAPENRHY